MIQAHLRQCQSKNEKQQGNSFRSSGFPFSPLHRQRVLGGELSHSSAALVAKGLLSQVAIAQEAQLRAELTTSIPGAKFVGAFQVQNPAQRGVYTALRASMCQQASGDTPQERELWHGTSWATVEKILQQGFNRIFCGRHGTLLGAATYFSADIAYSHRFCDRGGGGNDNTKVMILAHVLIGRYCKGSKADLEPPLLDAKAGVRYDSTVDNENSPKIFAVFRDFQACPLFLLEFQT